MKLRDWRIKHGLSKSYMARSIGVGVSTYILIERGEVSPLSKHGTTKGWAWELATVLNTLPEMLWPTIYGKALDKVINRTLPVAYAETQDFDIERLLDHRAFLKLIDKIIETLPKPKMRKIIRLRFGIGGGDEMTRDAVGRELGIGGERVRQLETRACSMFRHPHRSTLLRDFYKSIW